MKFKNLLIIPVVLLLLAGMVSAITFPLPIAGKVTGTTVNGIEIVVTNTRTGDYEVVRTNNQGEFMSEAANYPDGYREGDIFKLEISECKTNSKCVKTVQFVSNTETPLLYVSFDITGILCPTCEVCEDCEECEECDNINDMLPDFCPEIDELCTEEFERKCRDIDTTYYDEESCKSLCDEAVTDYENPWITIIIGGLLSLVVVMGGGIKFYKSKSTKIKDNTLGVMMQHKHKGIKAYHNINVKHKNPKYSHRIFMEDPIGFFQDVTKINNEGGLV